MNVVVPALGTFAFDDAVGRLVASMLAQASRDDLDGEHRSAYWRRRIASELAQSRGARVESVRRLPHYGPSFGRYHPARENVEVAS